MLLRIVLTALAFLSSFSAIGQDARPVLGITFLTPNIYATEALDLPIDQGVIITGILPKSPASEAGLKKGDVLLSIDGDQISSDGKINGQLMGEYVFKFDPGSTVEIFLLRKGIKEKLDLKLDLIPYIVSDTYDWSGFDGEDFVLLDTFLKSYGLSSLSSSILEAAIRAGYYDAMPIYGGQLLDKNNNLYNPKRLKDFANQMVEQGCGQCNYMLSHLYIGEHESISGTPNIKNHFKYLELASKYNNSAAQYMLYMSNKNGNFIPKNEIKAREYLELAASNGHTLSLVYYADGLIFGNDPSIPKSISKAKELVSNYFLTKENPFLEDAQLQYMYGYVLEDEIKSRGEELRESDFGWKLIANAAALGHAGANTWLSSELKNMPSGKRHMRNGLPRYVWHTWRVWAEQKREVNLYLAYSYLMDDWKNFKEPLVWHQKWFADAEKLFVPEKYGYRSLLANWLYDKSSPIGEKYHSDGLMMMIQLARKGDVNASRNLFTAITVRNERNINDLSSVFNQAADVLLAKGNLNDHLMVAFEYGNRRDIFFDINKSKAIYEKIINTEPQVLPRMLNSLILSEDPSPNHSQKDDIQRLINKGLKIKFVEETKQDWINSLWMTTWSFDLSDDAAVELFKLLSDKGNRKTLESEFRYFKLLVSAKYKAPDEVDDALIVRQFDVVKNHYIEAAELFAQVAASKMDIESKNDLILKALKRGLHLFVTKQAKDRDYINLSDFTFIKLIEHGFQLSISEGDLEAALYFHDAFDELVAFAKDFQDKNPSQEKNSGLKYLKLISEYQRSVIAAESGHLTESLKITKSILKEAESEEVLKFGISGRLDFIAKSAIVLVNLREYKILTDSIMNLMKSSTATNLEEKGLLEYAAIQGEIYALYQNDEKLANEFRSYVEQSEEQIIINNPSLLRDLYASRVYRSVFFKKDYELADKILREIKYVALKTKEKVRHWEVQFMQLLTAQADLDKQFVYATKWRELTADLYIEGVIKRVSDKRIVTPREKQVVSNFAFDLISDPQADKGLKFSVFQFVQGLAASRALDAKSLSSDQKRELFIHSERKGQTNYLISNAKLNIEAISERKLRDRLLPNQAALGVLFSDTGSVTWYATNDSSGYVVSQIPRERVAGYVKEIIESLRGEAFASSQSNVIFENIIKPALSKISDKVDHLIISPSSELAKIPLSILVTRRLDKTQSSENVIFDDEKVATRGFKLKKSVGAISRNKWLIEDYAISIVPALRSIQLQREERSKLSSLSFLGLGAPVLGGKSDSELVALRGSGLFSTKELHKTLVELPEAKKEIEVIASYFNQSKLLLEQEATEKNFLTSNPNSYDVISFATHALKFDELKDSQEPSLVLTLDGASDGLLTSNEILGLDLSKTKLVMLSACNTASSSGYLDTEGYSGLASSFLSSGAKEVLVSHWSVYSQAATDLTTKMMASEEMGFPKKLQDAMKNLLSSGESLKRHPAYWGAFSIVGN